MKAFIIFFLISFSLSNVQAQIKLNPSARPNPNTAPISPSEPANYNSKSCPGTPTVPDVDENIYNTVLIGNQCWMRENLRVTRYNDKTAIPLDASGGYDGKTGGQTWSEQTIGSYTVYGNDSKNETIYGLLYNWYAAKGIASLGSKVYKNICPKGWHVPTEAEWTILTTYLGGESIAGGRLKMAGTAYWNSPNTGATNLSGFSALPGAARSYDGSFSGIRNIAFFWSATENGNYFAGKIDLYCNNSIVYRDNKFGFKTLGASVRCLRD
jgi:uncharacterized protein (TIGR02145 family)